MHLIIYVLIQFVFTNAALTYYPEVQQPKIIGGHEAKPHAHPYIASLQMRVLWARFHYCGGALLNTNWILTAAHCVPDGFPLSLIPFDAVLGTHDVYKFDATAVVVPIIQKIKHPRYRGDIGPYDIAMFRLKRPVQYTNAIQPINLPQDFKANRYNRLSLAGWGILRTYNFLPNFPSSKLQEATLTYLPFKECYAAVDNIKESDEQNPLDPDANICTGPITGGIATCMGDSGGPLVYIPKLESKNTTQGENQVQNDADNEIIDNNESATQNIIEDVQVDLKSPTIIGVVSWGASPCGLTGAPSVYTNVFTYMDFINKHFNT